MADDKTGVCWVVNLTDRRGQVNTVPVHRLTPAQCRPSAHKSCASIHGAATGLINVPVRFPWRRGAGRAEVCWVGRVRVCAFYALSGEEDFYCELFICGVLRGHVSRYCIRTHARTHSHATLT
ncbi:hypothetical protein E2C01_088322 [Portunus trituberculatus]|uniref:Uncharacterized protein n=1 Tax=Portunus trituberculatus TaxID=210409 RepID=A0A5B7JE58_PORTR|nr:hypothetical protein [Portunus trituberculatus]